MTTYNQGCRIHGKVTEISYRLAYAAKDRRARLIIMLDKRALVVYNALDVVSTSCAIMGHVGLDGNISRVARAVIPHPSNDKRADNNAEEQMKRHTVPDEGSTHHKQEQLVSCGGVSLERFVDRAVVVGMERGIGGQKYRI